MSESGLNNAPIPSSSVPLTYVLLINGQVVNATAYRFQSFRHLVGLQILLTRLSKEQVYFVRYTGDSDYSRELEPVDLAQWLAQQGLTSLKPTLFGCCLLGLLSPDQLRPFAFYSEYAEFERTQVKRVERTYPLPPLPSQTAAKVGQGAEARPDLAGQDEVFESVESEVGDPDQPSQVSSVSFTQPEGINKSEEPKSGISEQAQQYAILLNGRLVGATPFLFETRRDVERLVRRLGNLTGARASAVQRGWCIQNPPIFSSVQVDAWLDKNMVYLVKPGHIVQDNCPDVSLRELVWPPDAWATDQSKVSRQDFDSYIFTGHGVAGCEPDLFYREEYPFSRSSLRAFHDMEYEREYEQMQGTPFESMQYIDILDEDLNEDSDSSESELAIEDEVTIVVDDYIDSPEPLNLEVLADSRHVVILQLGGSVVCDCALSFSNPAQAQALQQAVSEVLKVSVTSLPVSKGHQAKPFSLRLATDWIRKVVEKWSLDLRALEEFEEIYHKFLPTSGVRQATKRDVAPLSTQQLMYVFEVGGGVVCGQPLAFTASYQVSIFRQALSETLRTSVLSRQVMSETSSIPFDIQTVAQWLDTQGWLAHYRPAERVDLIATYANWGESKTLPPNLLLEAQSAQRTFVQPKFNETSAAIRTLLHERQIKQLVHFTRLDNLPGIVRQGILSRRDLAQTAFHWNDALRLDQREHATCLSISHPNYRMFYRYRQEHPQVKWAVLVLEPSLLWELDCGFVEINAASAGIPQRDEATLKGAAALEGMFGNVPIRTQLRLPEHFPTDPQAEVLVFEAISTRFIREIHVNFVPNVHQVEDGQGRSIAVLQRPKLFEARQDYVHWQNPVRF
ncbi:DarT ssDNA thymidine ADP-ribosyltransferase family protein [Deinococcus sp. QL22]|uniref:DarT ssDNA thymidine ADP-ribosyltransferase family protein n=1 Tax=Deinococcus sp. QL22 TaxID=2939437 RepID=UPI00201738AB|nr:DarT ssDNA thymidine ADP-ribosyltransferase family protein [Deinococcus sp. QL22]UQN08791.1 DUF4433 domain-containing protein [Deinococcus sp. QL22]